MPNTASGDDLNPPTGKRTDPESPVTPVYEIAFDHWSYWKGDLPLGSSRQFQDVHVTINGKPVGVNRDAIRNLESLDVKRGARVDILLPQDPGDLPSPSARPFFAEGYFLQAWVKNGASIRFFHNGKALGIRILMLIGPKPEDSDVIAKTTDDMEWVFDGIRYSDAQEAAKAVQEVNWHKGDTLIILIPKGWNPAVTRSSRNIDSAREELKEKGVGIISFGGGGIQ